MHTIKLAYLNSKDLASKDGHKVKDELDDFLMWCTANKIVLAGIKEDLHDAIMDEIEAITKYTNILHKLDTEKDRDLAVDLIHIRKDEEKHKQILEELETRVLNEI